MAPRTDGRYRLIKDGVVVYEGLPGTASMAHARAYEAHGQGIVVVVGELSDNPGLSVTASIETLAATIELAWFDGDGPFRLLEYDAEEQTFSEVTFAGKQPDMAGPGVSATDPPLHRVGLSADGKRLDLQSIGSLPGRFQEPRWRFASILDVLGVMPELVNPEDYTVAKRGGAEAEEFRQHVVRLQGERVPALDAARRA